MFASHREEYGIARLTNAILLLDKGKSCAEIAEFLYLDDGIGLTGGNMDLLMWIQAISEGGRHYVRDIQTPTSPRVSGGPY